MVRGREAYMVKEEGSSAVDAANMPVEQPSSTNRQVAAF